MVAGTYLFRTRVKSLRASIVECDRSFRVLGAVLEGLSVRLNVFLSVCLSVPLRKVT